MITYDGFKTFLVSHLWKTGDQVVVDALNILIEMANHELNTMLDAINNEVTTVIQVTTEDVPLPIDYNAFRDVYLQDVGELKYVTPADLFTQRDLIRSAVYLKIFSLGADNIYLVGPFNSVAATPLHLTYQRRIPDFITTNQSWFADNHLNAYTYAVLKHSGPFLREDERVQMWTALFEDAIAKIRDMSEHKQTRGRAGQQPLPYPASVIHRRRR